MFDLTSYLGASDVLVSSEAQLQVVKPWVSSHTASRSTIFGNDRSWLRNDHWLFSFIYGETSSGNGACNVHATPYLSFFPRIA